MSQYNFGVGTVIGKRTDLANTQVAFFGVVQEWELDIDQKLVNLTGQYKDPVDVAPSERTITGKIKFGRLQLSQWGNMLFGITPTANAGLDMVTNETKTTTTTTYTVAGGSAFTDDLGVYYTANGIALTPVVSAPTVGQYVPGVSGTGTYTINTSDQAAGTLAFFYMQTSTNQNQIVVGQALMGTGAVAELNFSNPYAVQGVTKKLNIVLPAVRISKAPLQFKNVNYMIPEMDFTAFLSASGTIMNWSMTE